MFFNRFNFSLSYLSGLKNCKADALSCQFDSSESDENPKFIPPPSAYVVVTQLDIGDKVLNAYAPAPSAYSTNHLYVPDHLRSRVLQWCHSFLLTCLPGKAHTTSWFNNASGGHPSSRLSGSLFLPALSVFKPKPQGGLPVVCYVLYLSPSGLGPLSPWTSSPGYPPLKATMSSSQLLTDSPRWFTSSHLPNSPQSKRLTNFWFNTCYR